MTFFLLLLCLLISANTDLLIPADIFFSFAVLVILVSNIFFNNLFERIISGSRSSAFQASLGL